MPNEIILSKMRARQTPVNEADSELADREVVFKLTEIDCYPPPGATAEYVKPTELPAIVLDRFLQDEERRRLDRIGFAADPAAFVHQDGVGVIAAQLGLAGMDISFAYRTDDYVRHRKTEPCHHVTLYLRARYDVVEIRVTADEALSVDGTDFPKGDEIATFRMAVPKKFRIEARYRWNPECCPVRPERGPEDFSGRWLPEHWKAGIEWKFQNELWPRYKGEYRPQRDW